MLAIVAPTAIELAGISRAVARRKGAAVRCLVTGIGRSRTIASLEAEFAQGVELVIMAGFCGAADPGMRTGDVQVADVLLAGEAPEPLSREPLRTDRMLVEAIRSAASGLHIMGGASATVGGIAGPAEKSRLHAETGAATVNMEDYWAARVADAHGVPFASIRVVLDTAEQELPRCLDHAADGGTAGLMRGLLRHPGSAAGLVSLGHRARIARRSLTQCVAATVAAMDRAEASPAAVAR